jgi:hypothetical protein
VDELGLTRVCLKCCFSMTITRLLTLLKTQEATRKYGWALLPLPPYSLSLAPSDFHLFVALKDVISSTKFESNDSVICTVRTWLHEQQKAWYWQGVHTLILSFWLGRRSEQRLWKNESVTLHYV